MECTTILMIFNEEGNIEPLTKDILKVYEDNDIDGEVLLVNDGSMDKSGEVCDRLAEEFENVRVIHHPQNIGRSYAIRTGFMEGKGDIHIIMDSDYQYEPKEIPQFLKKIGEGYDVVSGWRYKRADDSVRRFISKTYNKLIIKRIFKIEIKDQNSGFKAFKKEISQKMDFNPEGFLGLHRYILPLAKIKGASIVEIPIEHYDRPTGKSYIKFYTVPFITLRDYFKFKKKYMRK
jgi:glycosyltransferase involved in cell wall biosynthesis